MEGYHTNIKPPPHTQRRIGSERRPQGQSRHRGPVGTTPSRRSSPPAFPSPSSPTRSAHTYGTATKKENRASQTWPSVLISPLAFLPIIRPPWQCHSEVTCFLNGTNLVSTDWLPFAKLKMTQILAKSEKINWSHSLPLSQICLRFHRLPSE